MGNASIPKTGSAAQTEVVPQASQPVGDRRRAGRIAYVNTELIKLLRESPSEILPSSSESILEEMTNEIISEEMKYPNTEILDHDPLRAAKGIGFGMVLSTCCWTVICAAIWLMLRA